MKLSNAKWVLILIGVVIVAFVALGTVYSQESDKQSQLDQDLAQAQLILSKSSSNFQAEKQELNDKMSQAKAEIDVLKPVLSPSIESIEAVDSLFKIAQNCNMVILNVAATVPAKDKLNGANYATVQLTVKVQGQQTNILGFLTEWTKTNPTGVIQSVETALSVSKNPATTDNTTANTTDNTTDSVTDNTTDLDLGQIILSGATDYVTTLKLVTYTYRG
jgi:hypothetical protein